MFLGNEKLIENLKNTKNKLSHSYIVYGEDGIGKKTFVNYFIKEILNYNLNNPDIIKIIPEDNKITVDMVRSKIIDNILYTPMYCDKKIYIIQDAELMNEQSMNVLLKSLEEPPEYVMFFIITSNMSKLLETVKSRCQLIKINKVSDDIVREFLEKNTDQDLENIEYSVIFANGNIGKALQFCTSKNYIEIKNLLLTFLSKIDELAVDELILFTETLLVHKLMKQDILNIIALWYKDMLMLKATNDVNNIRFKNKYIELKNQSSIRTYAAIENILISVDKASIRIDANVKFQTVMMMLFLTIKEQKNK